MKIERIKEIKELASQDKAGTKEIIELVADGFLSQSQRTKELKAEIINLKQELSEIKAFLDQLTSPFFQIVEEDDISDLEAED